MVNLDKSNKDSIYVEKNHLIVTITSIGLTGIILAVVFALTDNTETGRNTVTDSSINCIVEDVGTVQNVNTKYVYLKDNNNIVYQFSVSSDVYVAMSRKKGDTISIFSKETLFGNVYY